MSQSEYILMAILVTALASISVGAGMVALPAAFITAGIGLAIIGILFYMGDE